MSAPDPFSRRREVAATSARSLLLTVLGEIVLPAGTPVWTQTVLDLLATVGVEEKSARQALARTAADPASRLRFAPARALLLSSGTRPSIISPASSIAGSSISALPRPSPARAARAASSAAC